MSEISWKEPKQARGKLKVDKILSAARTLIVEKNSLEITTAAVAEFAEVPIGSVYQFFPSLTSLMAKLFHDEMLAVDDLFRRRMVEAPGKMDLSHIERLLEDTYQIVLNRPVLYIIWVSASANPVIREADIANSKRNAIELSRRLHSLPASELDPQATEAAAMVICHLWGSLIHLCCATDDPSQVHAYLKTYAQMIAATIDKFSK